MAKRKVIDPEQGLLLALGHPLRKWLLKLIVEEAEPLSPKELAEYTKEHLSGVGYHVRQLEKLGAVVLVETKTRRGAIQHFYKPTELVMATPWLLEMLLLYPGMLREPTEEERARIREEVERRRKDPEFMARLRERLEEDRPLLEKLKEGEGDEGNQ